jgi:hypothetical protein
MPRRAEIETQPRTDAWLPQSELRGCSMEVELAVTVPRTGGLAARLVVPQARVDPLQHQVDGDLDRALLGQHGAEIEQVERNHDAIRRLHPVHSLVGVEPGEPIGHTRSHIPVVARFTDSRAEQLTARARAPLRPRRRRRNVEAVAVRRRGGHVRAVRGFGGSVRGFRQSHGAQPGSGRRAQVDETDGPPLHGCRHSANL